MKKILIILFIFICINILVSCSVCFKAFDKLEQKINTRVNKK